METGEKGRGGGPEQQKGGVRRERGECWVCRSLPLINFSNQTQLYVLLVSKATFQGHDLFYNNVL